MKDVIALITGGCSGLGAGAAQSLLDAGVKGIVVADLPHQKTRYDKWVNDTAIDDRTTNATRTSFVEMDVTNTDQVIHAFDRVEELYDGTPPNVIVNCAGIAKARKLISIKTSDKLTDNSSNTSSATTTIRRHSLDEFIQTMNINTTGTFLVSSIGAERMCRHQQLATEQATTVPSTANNYCIIHTASIAGYEGQIGQVAYAGSKGAIMGMTLPMARDLAPYRIRVMTIAPGLFATPLLQQLPALVQTELGQMPPYPNRLGAPVTEFGALVVHIIQNQYLNGSIIRLDGALRMPP